MRVNLEMQGGRRKLGALAGVGRLRRGGDATTFTISIAGTVDANQYTITNAAFDADTSTPAVTAKPVPTFTLASTIVILDKYW